MKKWLALAVGIVLVAAAIIGYIKFKPEKNNAAAPEVRTVEVRKGTLRVGISGSGTTSPVDKETIRMGKDSGKVEQILVKEGDVVKKGQVLITFEGRDMTNQIRQEELNLENKRADLESAQKALKEQGLTGNLEQLKSNIVRLQRDIETSLARLADYREQAAPPSPVTAPIDGEITSISVHEGQEVSGSATVGEIVDYGNLNVVIKVDELDIPKVKLGMRAEVKVDAMPGKTIEGEVTKISSQGTVENGVGVFNVTIGLKSVEGIKAGMSAEATIIIEEKKDVLLLPIEAVQQSRGQSSVFVPAENGETGPDGAPKRESKPVQLGSHNETMVEITGGLNEGDRVILPSSGGNRNNAQRNTGGPGGGFGPGGGLPRISFGGVGR
jgi:HlyD family secretion protein